MVFIAQSTAKIIIIRAIKHTVRYVYEGQSVSVGVGSVVASFA